MSTMPTTPAALLATLQQQIADLIAESAALTPIEAKGLWVVLSAAKIPLAFDIAADGGVTNPRTVRVGAATRLSKTNAIHVASVTRDGRGEVATAYPLWRAYEIAINELGPLLIALAHA